MANNKTPISIGTGGGGGGGTGTITTGANLGSGAQVYKGVNANALEFRTVVTGPGLSAAQEENEVRVSFTADMATQAELDAVEAVAYTAAEVALSTGVVEVATETFNLTRLSASVLRVSAIAKVVFDGDVTNYAVPQTDLDVSTMLAGLPTGTYIKHLHLQKPNTFLFLNARTSDTPNLMPLGTILVLSNGTAVTIATEVDPLPQPGIASVNLYALENAPARIELTTGPNADLTLFAQSGYYYGEAVNWANRNNIYKYPIAADNILSFRYVSPAIAVSSSVNPEVTAVDPTKYWNGTALVNVPNNNNATIQRLAWVPLLRSFAIQYGEVVYSTLQDAINALAEDSFTQIFAGSQAIEIARFAVKKNASNLKDNTQCIYVVAGESLGGVTGGSGGNTNLSTTRDATSVTIASDTGNDALIPAASATEAGVLTAADKSKLDGIAPGAQVNVPTNLSITYSLTNILISSSTGTDITVDPADSDSAGLLTAADKIKLDGIQAGAQVNVPTDLSITYTATNAQINSSTGLDATFNTATTSNAGLMSAADKTKLDGLSGGNGAQPVAVSSGTLDLSATVEETIIVSLDQNVTNVILPAGAVNKTLNRRIVFTQAGAGTFTVAGWTGVAIEGNVAPVAAIGAGSVTEYMLSNTNNSGWRMYVDQGITTAQVGQLGGFRNKIINGNMSIDQRNNGVAVVDSLGVSPFCVDRWRIITRTGATITAQPSSSGSGKSRTHLAVTITSAKTPASTDQFRVTQSIEGLNISDLWLGTALAKTITLSFDTCHSVTGTFSGALFNADFSRSFVFNYTQEVANTWESKSITLALDTVGTWLIDTSAGLIVSFDYGSGSSLQTATLNTWQAGGFLRSNSSNTLVSTVGAVFRLQAVQLEASAIATPFEHRPYGVELSLCSRYAQVFTGLTVAGTQNAAFYFSVPMREIPTISNLAITAGTGAAIAALNTFGAYQTAPNSQTSGFTALASAEL